MRSTRSLVFAALASFLLAAPVVFGVGWQTAPPQQPVRQSGTAAKMRGVPRVDSRAAEPETRLSEPTSGVIPGALVQRDESGQVRRVEGQVTVQGAANARDAADKFLERNARQLGLAPLLASRDTDTGLRLVHEVKSLTASYLTYQQFYGGLPVFDDQIRVGVNDRLRVTFVDNAVDPVPPGRSVPALTNSDAAVRAAVAAVRSESGPSAAPKAEAGIVMSKAAGPAVVWRVRFKTRQPGADWEVLVDAETNQVTSVRNIARYVNGSALIYKPNPVTTSGVADLPDNDNKDFTPPTRETVKTVLRELDGTGHLQGKYATTAPTTGFKRASNKALAFNFGRAEDHFEEVMAYHWVTEGVLYLRSLGFQNILTSAVGIDVNGTPDDQSWFSPSTGELTFGTGGVDDAEDADIILHELGHAILHSQVPGFAPDQASEAGAISEAFGDYYAATFFAGMGPRGTAWDAYVGEWDATTYNPGTPGFLRRVDGAKHYPEDLDGDMEPHNNGEIWSAVLWRVRGLLGKSRADKLIIESQFRLKQMATFAEAAEALIAVNQALYSGKDAPALRKVFVDRGILNASPAPATAPATPERTRDTKRRQ